MLTQLTKSSCPPNIIAYQSVLPFIRQSLGASSNVELYYLSADFG